MSVDKNYCKFSRCLNTASKWAYGKAGIRNPEPELETEPEPERERERERERELKLRPG